MKQGLGQSELRHSPATAFGHSAIMNPLYPNQALPLAEQPPAVLLAMCIFGEARGESALARRAVAQVVVNRARHAHRVFGSQRGLSFDENIIKVLTRPCQFSCMLTTDINYPKIFDPLAHEAPEVWHDCMAIAAEVMRAHSRQDILTRNADHYFDDSIQPPSWADPAKETVTIGRLRFFRLYLPALRTGDGTARPTGRGQAAGTPPSLSNPSMDAAPASVEPPQPSFPAAPAPMIRFDQYGLTRWLGGRELSSLGTGPRERGTEIGSPAPSYRDGTTA